MDREVVSENSVKLDFEIALDYVVNSPFADFVFNIHASHTEHQTVLDEGLSINQSVAHDVETDSDGNRWLRLRAQQGPLSVKYRASVKLTHVVTAPQDIYEVDLSELPLFALRYLRGSRYCQSDRLLRLATSEFSGVAPGYERVQAIYNWVRNRVSFQPQTSNVTTSAMDTLVEQVGVCRDFAHLMIALCRAMNMPARFVTGIDYGADPALGPVDFHAYVEVFLSGRWYMFDPSGLAIPMGFVRLGTGRDAADAAFATMFGNVNAGAPVMNITAYNDAINNLVMPFRTQNLLSTSKQ